MKTFTHETLLSFKEANGLKYGQILHEVGCFNKDRTPRRWRVNGKVKRWIRSPERIQIPIKHGLYSYSYITEKNMDLFYLPM